jgi:protein tyrosine phosphatase
MTEGECYKDKLVGLSKKLQKMNRYSDMIPCKLFCLIFLDKYNMCTIKTDCEDITEENYINASFINVTLKFNH